jgi:WD40 repeat protein
MSTDKVTASRAGGHAQIEKMCYDDRTGFLAVASADKRISLINTSDIKNGKIISIEEHSLQGKVKTMDFNSLGTIFALTENNYVRFWYTDIKKYAEILSGMRLKPLTSTEKELILGKEFSNIEDF